MKKKLLIKEITRCNQCAYISKHVGLQFCKYDCKSTSIPDVWLIANFCPLPDVEGTNKKMLIKEIECCYDCSYCNTDSMGVYLCTYKPNDFMSLEVGDVFEDNHVRHNIHHNCPLPNVTPNPEE